MAIPGVTVLGPDRSFLHYAGYVTGADRLAAGLAAVEGVAFLQPVDANELFVRLPAGVIRGLREQGFEVYDWPAPAGTEGPVVRLVTSWDMAEADIDAFVTTARRAARPA